MAAMGALLIANVPGGVATAFRPAGTTCADCRQEARRQHPSRGAGVGLLNSLPEPQSTVITARRSTWRTNVRPGTSSSHRRAVSFSSRRL
jgi:hypothetical protein